jgi:eukaryotic-like serine/threonine-protein kinase
MESDVATETSVWRDHVIMWVKDASRALDYAQTRPDLDHDKVAYYGYSWGSEMGGIIPAVEPRIKVCVFVLVDSTSIAHYQKSTPSTSFHG